MLSKLFKGKQIKEINEQQEQFNKIMQFTERVFQEAEENQKKILGLNKNNEYEHPILDVIRLLGRNIQTRYLSNLLYEEDESVLDMISTKLLLFDENRIITKNGEKTYELFIEQKCNKLIDLNKDLVLPWPWKTERLITSITNIGYGRSWGQWKQDKNNHYITLWLPLGIGWVYGGNHSISVGIIQGSGLIKPKEVYDISRVYDYVYTDGNYYYSIEDDRILSSVSNVEFAAIFEIGRKMVERSISY